MYITLDGSDQVLGNVVGGITSTAFSNASSSITEFHSSSVQTSSDAGVYQWEVYNIDPAANTTAEVQFSVAYGHYAGSGSAKQTGASTGVQPTRMIYSQYRQLLLSDTAPTTKFPIGDGTTSEKMYFITMNRARYKQGVNAGNWELHLSSSTGEGVDGTYLNPFASGAAALNLIDDSSVSSGEVVNGHLTYNIVSGSEANGPYISGSAYHYWGKFYPQLGIFALDGTKINRPYVQGTPGLELPDGVTSAAGASTNYDDGNTGKIDEAIQKGKYFAARAQEDVTSSHYFIRAKNFDFNYSTNPSYTTGSNGQLRHPSFVQNPQTYITTVGLYNDSNELLAVAKLSKPLLKNFERETTIRVKLDY